MFFCYSRNDKDVYSRKLEESWTGNWWKENHTNYPNLFFDKENYFWCLHKTLFKKSVKSKQNLSIIKFVIFHIPCMEGIVKPSLPTTIPLMEKFQKTTFGQRRTSKAGRAEWEQHAPWATGWRQGWALVQKRKWTLTQRLFAEGSWWLLGS